MIDSALQAQINQAIQAKREVERQQRIEDQAASLESLQREAQRQANIEQGINWLSDAKSQAAESLQDISRRVEAWHGKVAELERLLSEVIKERESLNGEIRTQALNVKRSCDFLQSQFGEYRPEYDFASHWQDVGGESLNLNIRNDHTRQIIDPNRRGAYTGHAKYYNRLGGIL